MELTDLKSRIKALLREIEFVHLKKVWPERLIAAGIGERDAQVWAAEIGHIVDEYERSLRYLVELIYEPNPRISIAEGVESWAAYTEDLGVFKIEDSMGELQKRLKKYLPPNELELEDEKMMLAMKVFQRHRILDIS